MNEWIQVNDSDEEIPFHRIDYAYIQYRKVNVNNPSGFEYIVGLHVQDLKKGESWLRFKTEEEAKNFCIKVNTKSGENNR